MKVALTGGTGLVGSAVLRALVDGGHEVLALVRSEDSAAAVRDAGATAALGDLTDGEWVERQFADADGAIHTASPGDATSADFDTTIAQAAVNAFGGTGKPYVHTSGAWVYGPGDDLTEDTAFAAPQLTAWRAGVERMVLDAEGVRAVIVAPGIVYGHGGGLPAMVTTPDDDGNFRTVGDGHQHWLLVSDAEIADLYVRALTHEDARGYYIGVNDSHTTVREIAQTAAEVAGANSVKPESDEDSAGRLGDLLAEALLLDQIASNAKARTELGWDPSAPSLLDEIRAGGYPVKG